MNSSEIRTRLHRTLAAPNSPQSVRHLSRALAREEPETVLAALLDVFFEDSGFSVQKNAGGLLWVLRPAYSRNLHDDIRCSLKYWNASIEELPWYLAVSVGLERVRSTVNSIIGETLEERSSSAANTYLYWLGMGAQRSSHLTLLRSESDTINSFRSELDQKWRWLGE